MLPLSGRLEAASKSNSSTLDPSRITTLVSSGWLESISMRLVMEISGARAAAATDMKCGWRIGAARIVDESQAREPVRRNGLKTWSVLGRDSVGWERKFDSHWHV